ncbi:hypothetical protein [Streptomyces sp. NPDC087300]|uniref:hypothetical protein n=1 Tax=Streptomyces sp. NPDC087300 TaxID=3365780 RepID=UPI0037F10980
MTHAYDTPDHDTRARDTHDHDSCDVLLSSHDVADDGLIALHVLGPTRGVPAAVRTHEPERLRRLLREGHGPAQWQPGRNLLRLGREHVGTTPVCAAVEAPRR